MPLWILERGRSGEGQHMLKRPGHAHDAVLDIGTEAVQFVYDEHLVVRRIDVR